MTTISDVHWNGELDYLYHLNELDATTEEEQDELNYLNSWAHTIWYHRIEFHHAHWEYAQSKEAPM